MNWEWLHILSGPLIGAVIGYFTNYIAVKMLFRPHYEKKIGNFRIPFTPGLIPKRKNDLASAVGRAVANSLLTEEDMSRMLLSDEVEDSVTSLCMKQLKKGLKRSDRMGDVILKLTGDELYENGRENLKEALKEKIMNGIMEADPGKIIAVEGKKAVQEMLAGTMFAMFLHGETLDSMAESVGAYAENYIKEKAPGMIVLQLEKEIALLEEKRVYQVGEPLLEYEAVLEEKVRGIYRICIGKVAASIVSQFRIDAVIEQKIRDMDVCELEDLVMSVMKHELGMIVNLGALIGFILGLINIFI